VRATLIAAASALVGAVLVANPPVSPWTVAAALAELGPNSHNPYAPEIAQYEAAVEREPCDRQSTLHLVAYLREAGAYREAIRRADAFLSRCGDLGELHGEEYHAYLALSEFKSALAEINKLVALKPYDSIPWAWRGLLHETTGELEEAIADFRQALAVNPRLMDIPINLANVYERMNRPCDAVNAIEGVLLFYPEARQQDDIRDRIERLYRVGTCDKPKAGTGQAVIEFPAGAQTAVTRAAINGRAARLVLDTGAAFVTVSQSFAKKVGIDTGRGTEVLLATASSLKQGRLTTVKRIELQGLRAENVEVVVLDEMPAAVKDGLLGMSFLGRFRLAIDRSAGKVTITTRSR